LNQLPDATTRFERGLEAGRACLLFFVGQGIR